MPHPGQLCPVLPITLLIYPDSNHPAPRFITKTAVLRSDRLLRAGNRPLIKSPQQLINSVSKTKWIAYAKRPFAGPEQVLEYFGRYTHRVAISNNRIIAIDNGSVTFTYRDRKRDNKIKEMTLDADEFIRRFLLQTTAH